MPFTRVLHIVARRHPRSLLNKTLLHLMSASPSPSSVGTREPGRSWWSFPRWVPTSSHLLHEAEKNMVQHISVPYEQTMVEVDGHQINTIKAGRGPPLVLVHGFAAGVGFWCANIPALSSRFTVYALDLVGFGRSSRPLWRGSTPADAEELWVTSLNKWATAMGLSKFTLLGHSMGGYISACYALRYPHQIQHLVLADPWGVPRPPALTGPDSDLPFRYKMIIKIASMGSPLSVLRAAGPWGPGLVTRFRSDIPRKFAHLTPNLSHVSDYIYHLNAQLPATGEQAFQSLTVGLGWAKAPIIDRLPGGLPASVPTTLIYGAETWMDLDAGVQLKNSLTGPSKMVVVEDAGHHLYIDNSRAFNAAVLEVADQVHHALQREHVERGRPAAGVDEIVAIPHKRGEVGGVGPGGERPAHTTPTTVGGLVEEVTGT
eukprot:TRINITY_DN8935_c0_g1_i2.p1 TRINITY_DN8935_c0_g1~~TRINITY_DN8935_c0_g1_i2.p1  ORF type:complete len:430 (-),score=81.09 TRINITY_DN8935_c0_g1_i2:19-1308(-)